MIDISVQNGYYDSILICPAKKSRFPTLFLFYSALVGRAGETMIDEDSLYNELVPICNGLGLSLVDCRFNQIKTGFSCMIILWKESGVSTEDCARIYRTIQPRLEVLTNSQDIHLEVSSPGTDRKIRLPREYGIFINKGFTVILRNGQTHGGILAGHDGQSIQLKTKGGDLRLLLSDIVKSKLDYTQEVS